MQNTHLYQNVRVHETYGLGRAPLQPVSAGIDSVNVEMESRPSPTDFRRLHLTRFD